ncbi:HAD family hydrolase [Streptomyces sp. NPDC051452]|uniref:HAD family hydrolase n=1 Tax=Streptomyces sp. NPDC051452 TaxID=3365654 RepID=UPI0037B920C5
MVSRQLLEAVQATESVFFDFDGPICDVFSGIPASEVARNLVETMREFSHEVSKEMEGKDFMDALRLSPQGGERALRAVEERLIESELAAVKAAGEPTPGAVASLEAARTSGRTVAIVSNNSAECVQKYLAEHHLSSLVQEISGRPIYKPHLMKPAPYSLLRSSGLLGVAPERCTLVGDSVSDVEAAVAAGARSIGFANREGKDVSLADAGADAVIGSMDALAEALAKCPGR